MKKVFFVLSIALSTSLFAQSANAAAPVKNKAVVKSVGFSKASKVRSIPAGKGKYLTSNATGANLDTATAGTPAPTPAPTPTPTPAPTPAPTPVATNPQPVVPAQPDSSTAVISKLVEMVKALMDANASLLSLSKSQPTNSVVTTVNPIITVNPVISPTFQQTTQNTLTNTVNSTITNNPVFVNSHGESEEAHR